MTIKLLCYADGGARTGFERVAREVLTYLHQTGDYEILFQGTSGPTEPYAPYPFRYAQVSAPTDPLGWGTVQATCQRFKPHLLFAINDLWNLSGYAALKPADVPMVGYFPVDAPNVKWQFCVPIGAMDRAVTYTAFAAKECSLGVKDLVHNLYCSVDEAALEHLSVDVRIPHPQFGHTKVALERIGDAMDPGYFDVIGHGRDPKWGRASEDAILAIRQRFGLEDLPLILNANANQSRKRLDTTLRIVQAIRRDFKVPAFHTVLFVGAGLSNHGYDLEQLVQYYGLTREVTIIRDPLTDDELMALHSAASIGLNTSGGEGWGLGIQEGALCGVAQVCPEWSATLEIWGASAVMLPPKDYRVEPMVNTHHCILDVPDSASLVAALLLDETHRVGTAQRCLARALQIPTWDQVGAAFDRVLRETIIQEKPAPTNLHALHMRRFGGYRIDGPPA